MENNLSLVRPPGGHGLLRQESVGHIAFKRVIYIFELCDIIREMF